jgi:lysophospholipase L1-like esterase
MTRLAAAALILGVAVGLAQAQSATPATPDATSANTPMSKACQSGNAAGPEATPLPNVAEALAQRKEIRILTMGSAPGRITAHGEAYTAVIEAMLEHAIKGIDVIMINRGVSGELAANAATRMKNEVALNDPDLVLWQVGTNDALAYVSADEFAATLKSQLDWLKAHKVDAVLVGLQFANRMLRDAHYVEIRETLRALAARENVIVIRFYEAMQMIDQAAASGGEAVGADLDRNEPGYNCLAQYVARAITLGVFAKNMPKNIPKNTPRPQPPK